MKLELKQGNSLEVLKEYSDNTFDSVVTDPPYGLSFMGKKWDYDVPTVELWREVLRVLKPGGHLVSFSSSRTYHRMTVNVEDAGFEVRDQLMWLYGSGFPKSHNIGKAYDKKLGKTPERLIDPEFVMEHLVENSFQHPDGRLFDKLPWIDGVQGIQAGTGDGKQASKKVYVEVTTFDNQFSGWGTALKPAHEPIVLARKPLSEKTIVDNVIRWGTGGINIDGSRVAIEGKDDRSAGHRTKSFGNDKPGIPGGESNVDYVPSPEGRFPANIIHDGSPEVLDAFPTVQKSTNYTRKKKRDWNAYANEDPTIHETEPTLQTGGRWEPAGSAARFFYCAKVSKKERNAGLEDTTNNHPTVKPVALMAYLCKLITPKGGTILDPFMGSGSTGMAAKQEGFSFTGIDLDEAYVEIAQARIDAW